MFLIGIKSSVLCCKWSFLYLPYSMWVQENVCKSQNRQKSGQPLQILDPPTTSKYQDSYMYIQKNIIIDFIMKVRTEQKQINNQVIWYFVVDIFQFCSSIDYCPCKLITLLVSHHIVDLWRSIKHVALHMSMETIQLSIDWGIIKTKWVVLSPFVRDLIIFCGPPKCCWNMFVQDLSNLTKVKFSVFKGVWVKMMISHGNRPASEPDQQLSRFNMYYY